MIVSDFSPPALYVATYGQRLNFKQIPVDGGRRNITAPAAVDYDPVERRVYWTQWSGKWTNEGNICRCDLKGNFYQVLVKQLDCEYVFLTLIRRRSDYIIGFVTPAIGPNKSEKLTRLIAPAHNIRSKVWMKSNTPTWLHRKQQSVKPCMLFHPNFAAYIACRRYQPCEFPGFVWTDCWGNKFKYVITSLGNLPV